MTGKIGSKDGDSIPGGGGAIIVLRIALIAASQLVFTTLCY